MSRKVARFELEKRLDLAEDALKVKREEINLILDKIVEELQGLAGDASSDSSAGADSVLFFLCIVKTLPEAY